MERHLVVATDDRFGLPTATALRSISEVFETPAVVTVLADGVSDGTKGRIIRSVDPEVLSLRWVDVSSLDLGQTGRSPIGRTTYVRLALGELMPPDIKRVLYLDVDLLVLDDLADLWNADLRGHAVGAVRSVHYPSICTYGAMDNWPSLNLDPRAPYFNAGVMVVDLEVWRGSRVGERAFRYLASDQANGRLADQEALNAILAGQWHELHPRWNVQSPFMEDNRGVQLMYDDATICAARSDPAIVHFINRPKPWHVDCRHPLANLWREVASRTAYAPVSLERTALRNQLRWRVKRAASALFKGR